MDDTILATNETTLESLRFPRLESVQLDVSNLVGIRSANIESLLVPSLRSLNLDRYGDDWKGDNDRDCEIFLTALKKGCASLSTLSLDFKNKLPKSAEPLLFSLLDEITAIEDLRLNRLSKSLIEDYSPKSLLQNLLSNKPNLVSLCFPRCFCIREEHVDGFLKEMGPAWTIPSLRTIVWGPGNAPTFSAGMAASQLLDRMPSLRQLSFEFADNREPWGDELKCVFDSMSKLKHLESLNLGVRVRESDVRGEWLTQLGNLKNLDSVVLNVFGPCAVSITAAQMACFLSDHPNLKVLELGLGAWDLLCSPEEKVSIEDALARIAYVDIEGMTFVTQDAL